jgi:hypothetical protein
MAQLDLFGSRRLTASVPQKPDIDKIRALLNAALHQLRTADEMPWQPHQLRSWHHVFHNMTKWLPTKERDQFRESFEAQISRLQKILPMFQGPRDK